MTAAHEIPPAIKERFDRMRTGILLDLPFFGSLMVRMPFMRDDSFKTMATDGRAIFFNAGFVQACDDNELRYTVAHELLHPAMGHLWRIGDRVLEDFNQACDYAVNQMLDDYAAETTPTPWQRPKSFLTVENHPEYRGLSPEEIYELIRAAKQPPEPPQQDKETGAQEERENGAPQPGGGQRDPKAPPSVSSSPDPLVSPSSAPRPAQPGSFMPPPPDATEAQPGEAAEHGTSGGRRTGEKEAGGDNLEDDWKIATAQAEQSAKMKGNCPGAAKRLVQELKEPKVSWREVLREFIRRAARDDYSWNRPNKRHLARGFILPSLYSERMGRLVCAIDTSGSINTKILAEFQAEVQAALDELRPEAVEIIVCDAKVHGPTQRFEPGDEVKIDAKGGGGTDFRPVFTLIDGDKEQNEPPAAVVYFTDLMGTFPDTEPNYPVLWAGYDIRGTTPPWGELVKVS